MADEFSVLSREYLARKDDSAAIPVKINSSGIGPAHYDVCSMSTCTYVYELQITLSLLYLLRPPLPCAAFPPVSFARHF